MREHTGKIKERKDNPMKMKEEEQQQQQQQHNKGTGG